RNGRERHKPRKQAEVQQSHAVKFLSAEATFSAPSRPTRERQYPTVRPQTQVAVATFRSVVRSRRERNANDVRGERGSRREPSSLLSHDNFRHHGGPANYSPPFDMMRRQHAPPLPADLDHFLLTLHRVFPHGIRSEQDRRTGTRSLEAAARDGA